MHGQVKLRHHGGNLGHGINGLGQKVLGVRGGEVDALDARLAHAPQELGEARSGTMVATV